jgi:RHS repeat-associated protein
VLSLMVTCAASHYRARYYDAGVGRFIKEDPAGFDAGSPNFFAYVANDPIEGIDPFGLKCIRKADACYSLL